jgi:hypothetical protein
MTLQCSLQLYRYLRARRAGCPTEQAAAEAGIGLAEARLHDADEAKGLLSNIDTTEMPQTGSPQSTAPAAETKDLRESVNAGPPGAELVPAKVDPGAPPKEEEMARAKRKVEQVEEVQKPDFELARRIYFNDIKPAVSKQATHGQELSEAYKEIQKTAHVDRQMAKLAFKLSETEESKRDHMLRSLKGMLEILRIYMPRDMVDVAEGKPEDSNVIPIGDAQRPQLATIQNDDDLAGDIDATWRAGLKEGDAVLLPAEGDGGEDIAGVISFVDGDDLDVDAGEETITLPRSEVIRPTVAPAPDQQIAAE